MHTCTTIDISFVLFINFRFLSTVEYSAEIWYYGRWINALIFHSKWISFYFYHHYFACIPFAGCVLQSISIAISSFSAANVTRYTNRLNPFFPWSICNRHSMFYRINSRKLHTLPFGFVFFKQINVLYMIVLNAKTKINVPIATFAERWNFKIFQFSPQIEMKIYFKIHRPPAKWKTTTKLNAWNSQAKENVLICVQTKIQFYSYKACFKFPCNSRDSFTCNIRISDGVYFDNLDFEHFTENSVKNERKKERGRRTWTEREGEKTKTYNIHCIVEYTVTCAAAYFAMENRRAVRIVSNFYAKWNAKENDWKKMKVERQAIIELNMYAIAGLPSEKKKNAFRILMSSTLWSNHQGNFECFFFQRQNIEFSSYSQQNSSTKTTWDLWFFVVNPKWFPELDAKIGVRIGCEHILFGVFFIGAINRFGALPTLSLSKHFRQYLIAQFREPFILYRLFSSLSFSCLLS